MQQLLLELAARGQLAGGEGALDLGSVVRERDAEVVPGLAGDLVLLVVKGLRLAVCDGLQHAGFLQGLRAQILVADRRRMPLGDGLLDPVLGLAEAVEIQLEPIQAVDVVEVEALLAGTVVDQQGFVLRRGGQQQGAVVAVVFEMVLLEPAALMQVVPVDLGLAALRDLRGRADPASLPRAPYVLQGEVLAGLVAVEGPHQPGQVDGTVLAVDHGLDLGQGLLR